MPFAPRIAHVDMDAFYASVELLRYPELRGLPLAIGGRREHQPITLPDGSRQFMRLRDYTGRGVLTTATYEARALGIGSGMGTMKAARLAPDAVLLPVDFDAYRDCSRRFKAAVARIAPKIENRGIDEIYVDLSDLPDESIALGRSIKAAVQQATGLTCSIGIAPNKLLAKIGSDLEKPDGLTILSLADVPARIWPLPARRINGIGPRAAERLARLGIATIGELAHADEDLLREHFGNNQAAWLLAAANGIDHRAVVTSSDPKSVSRETTFERDLHVRSDRAELAQTLTNLCQHLAQDLQRQGWAARTIGVKLRYADFSTVTRDQTLAAPVADAAAIRSAATSCLRRVPLDRRLRLLGVRAGSLQRPELDTGPVDHTQGELLLDDPQD